ncbi:hypothetical protein BN133_3812 [Cronobacter dublinensis 582]|nr:hypothetical protein BN133_3812 [Cronobacter dublinensis 582]
MISVANQGMTDWGYFYEMQNIFISHYAFFTLLWLCQGFD